MRKKKGRPASFLDALVLDLAAEGGFSFLFLRGASEPVVLSAEGAKDPLLNETIG